MYAVMYGPMAGPAFEAELTYRRELAQRYVRAGRLWPGAPRRRTRRRRGLRLPAARPRPAATA